MSAGSAHDERGSDGDLDPDDIVEVDSGDDDDDQRPPPPDSDDDDEMEEVPGAAALGAGAEDDDEDGAGGQQGPDDAVHVFRGHTDSVYAVACSPSPSGRVASGGGDEVAYLWNIGEASDPVKLEGHTDSVSTLAFSNDGTLLASGGLDGVVHVWDAATGQHKSKLEGPAEGIEWSCWHPKGHVVLAGSEDFTAWMWNAATAACMAVFTGHSAPVTCGTFAPDGKSVLTGSADGSVRIWDPRSAAATATLSGHGFHSDAVTCMDVRAEGAVGVVGSADKTASVFSLSTAKVAGKLSGHEDSVECVALHPSLPIVATAGPDSRLCLWDLNSLQQRSTCMHDEAVVQVLWHPTQPAVLLSACADGGVRVWDGRSGACERALVGHEDSLLCMAVTRDGAYVVTGADDDSCRVFELA